MALPKLDNVIDLISETSGYKQALAERNAAAALHRKTLIGELRRLEREMQRTYPGLSAAVEAAIAAVKQAEIAVLEARRRLDQAAGAKASAGAQFTARHDRIERMLRDGASPAIKAFVSAMLDELERSRKAFSFQTQHEHHPITGQGSTRTLNNLTSVQRRVDAVRAAMAAAEEMAIAEADQSTVPARLDNLRELLPPVDPVLR